jgi:dTDP-4-dehydrorhamnose reductase
VLAQLVTTEGFRIEGRSGVYNLACDGEASWFRFAEAIFSRAQTSLLQASPKLIPIPTSEYPTAAKRPANSRLSCQRLAETFGVRLPAWEQALDLVMETLTEFGPRGK